MSLSSSLWLIGSAGLPSLLLTWAITFYIRRNSPRWGLVDRPNTRKVHTTPTPLGGGLAIGAGVIGTFLLGTIVLIATWFYFEGFTDRAVQFEAKQTLPELVYDHLPGVLYRLGNLWTILAGGAVLMVVGLIDDLRGLSWKLRLGIQFLVALICVWTQDDWRLTAFIEVGEHQILSELMSIALTVLWIVALINSFNMLDNMDGLSAGVAAIAASTLAVVMLSAPDPMTGQPQMFVAGFLLVLVGALIGFLWHNRPPARIFMGDAGSYFVGFSIAVATLLATFAGYENESTPHAVFAPLCVMAVPFYDMLTVIWIRLREGRSPFEPDKNHFSHRLVDLGLTKGQAVLTIYLTTATCGLGALLLRQVNLFGAAVVLLLVACVLMLIAILESTARRKLNE